MTFIKYKSAEVKYEAKNKINMATATTENISNKANMRRYVLYFRDSLLSFHQFVLLTSYIYTCRDVVDSWKTKLNLPPKDRRVQTTVSSQSSLVG